MAGPSQVNRTQKVGIFSRRSPKGGLNTLLLECEQLAYTVSSTAKTALQFHLLPELMSPENAGTFKP